MNRDIQTGKITNKEKVKLYIIKMTSWFPSVICFKSRKGHQEHLYARDSYTVLFDIWDLRQHTTLTPALVCSLRWIFTNCVLKYSQTLGHAHKLKAMREVWFPFREAVIVFRLKVLLCFCNNFSEISTKKNLSGCSIIIVLI